MAVQETTSRPVGGEPVEERPRGGELDEREVELDEPIADGESVVEAELGCVSVHSRRGLAMVGNQGLGKGPEAKRWQWRSDELFAGALLRAAVVGLEEDGEEVGGLEEKEGEPVVGEAVEEAAPGGGAGGGGVVGLPAPPATALPASRTAHSRPAWPLRPPPCRRLRAPSSHSALAVLD
uniref:Uncharacterized protein n=1 Tax=Oryza glumipatula TaxID=40148 RepID=A0A0E0BS01_9ORYZ